jgi:hypothetical protein
MSEVDVHWTNIVLIVGLCVTVTGLIFYVRCLWRRARIVSDKVCVMTSQHLESAGELWCQAALWGGIVLGLFANIAEEMRSGASLHRLAFSMVASAGMVLVWGVCIGRLSLRRQLRLEERR